MIAWAAIAASLLAGAPVETPLASDAGADRGLAMSALSAGRTAVGQAAPDAANRQEAAARLAQAEELFQVSRYAEAAKAADAAWQLVSANATEPTRFAVQVAEDGKTTVTSRTGHAVHVEAQGVTQAVYAGQTATVEKGQTPQLEGTTAPESSAPLVAPAPVNPPEGALFHFKPNPKGGLGPLRVAWTAVAGATTYEVEISPWVGPSRPVLVTSARPETRLPPMPAGKYRWTVRAVAGAGARSPPSTERSFELTDEELKLNVKPNTWK